MIVFLARDIPPFVMYCVNGKPRSSLFIESTDSMIFTNYIHDRRMNDNCGEWVESMGVAGGRG